MLTLLSSMLFYRRTAFLRDSLCMTTIGKRFARVRADRQISQNEIAKACGVSRAAVSQWEKDDTVPTGPNLVAAARALGVNPEWLAAGTGQRKTQQTAGTTRQTADNHSQEIEVSPPQVGHKLSTKTPNGDTELPLGVAHIREVDVQASAGGGAVVDYENDGSLWMFPEAWVRAELSAKPQDLRIVTIEGDSMVSDPIKATDLDPGDKVIVNVFDNRPTPPGIFLVHDGLGLVAKRVHFLPLSDPPTIKIISNNKLYKPYERTLEEANVVGRIVSRLQRL